jgi:hypothetical protein
MFFPVKCVLDGWRLTIDFEPVLTKGEPMKHYATEEMAYTLCKEVVDNGVERLETTDQPSLVTCEKCKQALSLPVHYATHPHAVIACKKKVIAMHLGMKGYTTDKDKVTCEQCLEILAQNLNSKVESV